MQLRKMKRGQKGKIQKVGKGDLIYRQRLLAMGLIPGTEFTISRIAPMGDPIEILVRGFYLSLRKREADILEVIDLSEAAT